MPNKEEPQLEETVEPTIDDLVEEATVEEAEEVDPTKPVINMQQMSLMLTNQTFTIIAALGEGLKHRYEQITSQDFKGLPPKVKAEKNQWTKGYIRALEDVAQGLALYQDHITERAISDGILTREETNLPEPEATATEADGQSE